MVSLKKCNRLLKVIDNRYSFEVKYSNIYCRMLIDVISWVIMRFIG